MKKILVLLLIVYAQNLLATTFQIELKKGGGIPKVSQVIQEVKSPPKTFSLQSFNSISPTSARYSIEKRAKGHLRAIMDAHPLWDPSRIQNYITVVYDDNLNKQSILSSLSNDPYIKSFYMVDKNNLMKLSAKQGHSNENASTSQIVNSIGSNIQSAWELSEGMGYIGLIDSGVQVNHPDIRAFDEFGNYVGGNLLDAYYHIDTAESTYDPITGDFIAVDFNIDELEALDFNTIDTYREEGIPETEICDANSIRYSVGHGTHTTGLIAAKGNMAPGICKNCGISMMKYLTGYCLIYKSSTGSTTTNLRKYLSSKQLLVFDTNTMEELINSFSNALYLSASVGVNVLNLSLGAQRAYNHCESHQSDLDCRMMRQLNKQEVPLIASAGNDRKKLNFPASDKNVIAVGGLTQEILGSVHYWNESPNGSNYTNPPYINTNCPSYPSNLPFHLTQGDECGSNYSYIYANHKLDLMAQAQNVYSTFYQGQTHLIFQSSECSDAFDGSPNDGYGLCTGTSMSAPQVSAIYQLMRSANPLLPIGTANPNTLIGLRNVINATADKINNQAYFDDHFGYGQPNARKALEVILGKSNNVQLKTRLTPMFEVVALDNNNNVYTPFSQIAVSFMLSNAGYVPNSSQPLVNEFTEFWYDDNSDNPDPNAIPVDLADPRAGFYIFTTNNNPFSGVKNMIPLRRMEKSVGSNRNDTYAVSNAEIQNFHNNGYNYAGIEGYILPSQESGTIALYRNQTDSMNHKLVTSNSQPPNSILLGYVYLNQDSDNDGLIDGQEIILGTNRFNQDSDSDGINDGVEYPPAGVPVSDPLLNPVPIFNSNINPALGLDFGNVEFGATSVKTIVVNNLGQGDLNVTSCSINNTNFTLSGCPFTIPGSSSIMNTVNVVCNPQNINTTTQLNATLTMNTNDPNSPQVNYPLTCKAIRAEYQSNVSQGQQIDFSFVNDGASASRSIEISNLGQGELQITGCSVSNTNFTVTGCPFNIPGSSAITQNITVQCTPSPVTETTTLIGTLTINTNDADEATVNYPMNCTALSSDALFADSGEPTTFNGACSLSKWSQNLGFTAATQVTTPRYNGICGFQQTSGALLSDTTPVNETRIRSRFYFYAQTNQPVTVLTAFSDDFFSNVVFTISYDGVNVSIQSSGNGVNATAPVSSTNWHSIEFDWNQNGQILLWVDSNALFDTPSAIGSASNLNNTIEAIVLGDPGTSNFSRIIFDDYESHRTTAIGRLVKGDANGSETVNIFDTIGVKLEILGIEDATGTPDCNEDGNVNVFDMICIKNIILGN